MARTQVFRTGSGQAVRIPTELAYENPDIELEIARAGDVITIYPACANLRDGVALLRSLPRPPQPERRDPITVPDRSGD